jgi:hypothetical protein
MFSEPWRAPWAPDRPAPLVEGMCGINLLRQNRASNRKKKKGQLIERQRQGQRQGQGPEEKEI